MMDNPKTEVRFGGQNKIIEFMSGAALPLAILILIIIGQFLDAKFLTIGNLVNVLHSMSIVGIIAVGMTFVLIAGGLADLSVPAMIAIGALVTLSLQPIVGTGASLIIAVTLAGICGFVCGALVGFLGINPIIASLSVGTIVLGIAQAFVGGVIVYSSDPTLGEFLKTKIFGVPFISLIFIGITIIGHIILAYSYWGRWVYATGGNYKAAKAGAIPVNWVKTAVFAATAICAGISGAILGLTLQQARPIIGTGYEFSAITAVVVGGASIMGGAGSIPRSCLGLLFVQLLTNILTLQGVATPIQGLILGVLIILAVTFDVFLRKKGARS